MRRLAIAFVSALALGLAAVPAFAQADNYPNKPIRVIVPYAPGGLTDMIARLVAENMRETLGQNLIVDNKPGGSGIIAIRDLVRSKPDGYTIMVGNVSTNGLTPILFRDRLEIDYDKEVTGIANLASAPAVVIANNNFAPNTFKEFIEYARANPNRVRYGSAGIGAYQQINSEHLASQEKLKMVHIPVKGGGSEIMQNLMTGDIQVTFFNLTNSARLMKEGKIKGYAITTDERHPLAPNLPTLAELGYAHIGVTQWQAAFSRSDVPVEIRQKLNEAFNKALQSPKVIEVYKNTGTVMPKPLDAKETSAWVGAEQARMKKIIAETGITVR